MWNDETKLVLEIYPRCNSEIILFHILILIFKLTSYPTTIGSTHYKNRIKNSTLYTCLLNGQDESLFLIGTLNHLEPNQENDSPFLHLTRKLIHCDVLNQFYRLLQSLFSHYIDGLECLVKSYMGVNGTCGGGIDLVVPRHFWHINGSSEVHICCPFC
jgi:hypothetical protein